MFWLASPTGSRIPIRSEGVVIGRGARCDVVVDEPEVSRTQAIVYAGEHGPTIAVLGKGPTAINGREVSGDHDLVAGDQLAIASRTFAITGEVEAAAPASAWMLRDPHGQLVGVTRTPFTIGGGTHVDLRVDGWPDVVMKLHLTERLHVEAQEPIRLQGNELARGDVEVVAVGAELVYAGAAFRLVAGGVSQQAATAQRRGGPDRVTLEFLARGGRLTVGWGERESCAYLPERRCELLALLLQPPAPHAAGEFVGDEIVIARLWPGHARTRVDLNVVIHRARADLVRAGLDATLIERSEGGNATRVAIEATTRVAIV